MSLERLKHDIENQYDIKITKKGNSFLVFHLKFWLAENEGPDSLQDICNFIEINSQTVEGRGDITEVIFTAGLFWAGISFDKLGAIFDCLEEVFGVNYPRPA